MAQHIDGRTVNEVVVDDEKLENVTVFCYFGNLFARGGWDKPATLQMCLGHALPTAPSDWVY